MYGAIPGDIIGSRFEFDRGGKTKNFELFTNECDFTDDTVMTIAVADGLMKAGKDADIDTVHEEVIKAMRKWGKMYPNAGYGGRFYKWLFWKKDSKPYGSFGNGSAMRVSRAGWLYDTVERTREVARWTAEVTHNHPEGIKGAECTRAVIFLARTGSSKEEIKEYVVKEFGYDFTETLDQMRKRHEHVETCQDSLPKALRSFFDGESFEDVIRNAVSLGGDTDTLAAIAGAMAEAFYGLPILFKVECDERITEEMKNVISTFLSIVFPNGYNGQEDIYGANKDIKYFADKYCQQPSDEVITMLLNSIIRCALEGAIVPMPMVDTNNVLSGISADDIVVGKDFQLKDDLYLKNDLLRNRYGKIFIPLFTDNNEIDHERVSNITMYTYLTEVISTAANNEEIDGIVLNPFSAGIEIPPETVRIIWKEIRENTKLS